MCMYYVCVAWHGKARQGMARHGKAREGDATQRNATPRMAWHGMGRTGMGRTVVIWKPSTETGGRSLSCQSQSSVQSSDVHPKKNGGRSDRQRGHGGTYSSVKTAPMPKYSTAVNTQHLGVGGSRDHWCRETMLLQLVTRSRTAMACTSQVPSRSLYLRCGCLPVALGKLQSSLPPRAGLLPPDSPSCRCPAHTVSSS